MLVFRLAVWAVTVLCLAVTLLPITDSHQWWIRMWDFPRVHIAATAFVAAALAVVFLPAPPALALFALVACGAYQTYRIFPYTALASEEIALVTPDGTARPITLLAANVLMENTEYQRVRELIQTEDPDVLLLMEIDSTWERELRPVLQRYATYVSLPLDNHYGMLFATKLKARSAEMVFLAEDETPTLVAELESAQGDGFHFVGLHPRPPVPGQDTHERDEQIRKAATFAHQSGLPVISMGDFNDVAWSSTSQKFKRHGDYFDPRVGRGLIPSFDANHPILRFPIDQLFVTAGVDLVSFGRGEHVGSDHFPMKATVIVPPGAARAAN